MNLALDEITNMQFEASNLIGHIQNRIRDLSYPLVICLDSYLKAVGKRGSVPLVDCGPVCSPGS